MVSTTSAQRRRRTLHSSARRRLPAAAAAGSLPAARRRRTIFVKTLGSVAARRSRSRRRRSGRWRRWRSSSSRRRVSAATGCSMSAEGHLRQGRVGWSTRPGEWRPRSRRGARRSSAERTSSASWRRVTFGRIFVGAQNGRRGRFIGQRTRRAARPCLRSRARPRGAGSRHRRVLERRGPEACARPPQRPAGRCGRRDGLHLASLSTNYQKRSPGLNLA